MWHSVIIWFVSAAMLFWEDSGQVCMKRVDCDQFLVSSSEFIPLCLRIEIFFGTKPGSNPDEVIRCLLIQQRNIRVCLSVCMCVWRVCVWSRLNYVGCMSSEEDSHFMDAYTQGHSQMYAHKVCPGSVDPGESKFQNNMDLYWIYYW